MNTQLNYMIAQQRLAELQRISERARPLSEVRASKPNPTQPASGEGAAAARGRQGWMAVALVLVGAGWGSNQFTPMLLVYRHALGLSAGSLEAMFGVYALGLIPGLLAGPLSDTKGRRLPVLAAATASLLGSLLLIAGSRSPALLYVGRFVIGLGSGAAFSAGTAWLRELSLLAPGNADPARAARRAVVAMTTGFAIGPLLSGMLAQVGAGKPGPAISASCGVHGRRVVRGGSACTRHDHTANAAVAQRRTAGREVATTVLRSVAVMAPWVFAAPAVAFAFLPAAVGADRLTGGVVVTGAVTALTALAGVLIQPAARALDALRWRRPVGMVGLLVCAAGLGLGAYAVQAGSLWLLAPCAAVLGCAYGLCLVSGLIEVGRLARPDAVGSLTSVYYALAYLGLTTPYLLTLASPLAGDQTLLLILAAAALTSAAAVASAGRPTATAAVDDHDRDALPDNNGVALDAAG